MSEDFIKAYWEKQAEVHQASHEASWGDNWMIELEIETIGKHISENDDVLDVGCANGYSAFRQLELKKPRSIKGIDFSENMIKEAIKRHSAEKCGENISFQVGDVRDLAFPDESFDVVYTTRVIINLPNWEEQLQGIRELVRVARPGGKVVLSEAFWEPLVLLNSLRALKQLDPLVEHDFNRYLKKNRLEKFLEKEGYSYECEDFSSVYYLGSRFLRELVTDPEAWPGYTNPINRIFYEIEKEYSGGEFGIQQAYVISKPVR